MSDITKQLEYLNETKSILKDAIINKGQSIEDTLPFRNYADKIQNIETGMLSQEEYNASVNITRNILGGSDKPSELIVNFDTYCNVDLKETIGAHASATELVVLGFDTGDYNTSALLKFDLTPYVIDPNLIERVELRAYYFANDIASRPQQHPIRRVITDWTNSTILSNSMMNSTIEGKMVTIDGTGYGWRFCDVTSMFKYWLQNPTKNYGMVIDNYRGQSDSGGVWARMRYYSKEYSSGLYAPRLVLTYTDGGEA